MLLSIPPLRHYNIISRQFSSILSDKNCKLEYNCTADFYFTKLPRKKHPAPTTKLLTVIRDRVNVLEICAVLYIRKNFKHVAIALGMCGHIFVKEHPNILLYFSALVCPDLIISMLAIKNKTPFVKIELSKNDRKPAYKTVMWIYHFFNRI